MKKVLILTAAALVVVLAAFAFSSCASAQTAKALSFYFLGSEARLVVHGNFSSPRENSKLDDLSDSINQLFLELEKEFSTEDNNSEINSFNKANFGEKTEVSSRVYNVAKTAKDLAEKTSGAFNPCCYLLSDLWGFTRRFSLLNYSPTLAYDRVREVDGGFSPPQQRYIEAFTRLADYTKLNLVEEGGKFYLSKDCANETIDQQAYTQQLDFAAIIKGYASELISNLVIESGYESFYCSLGESSIYLANNATDKDNNWSLNINEPKKQTINKLGTVKLKNSFVATAGTYLNGYEYQNEYRHHIIDAANGIPAETDLISATLICSKNGEVSGAELDGLATAAIVVAEQNAIKLLAENHISYILVNNKNEVITDLGEAFTLKAEGYTLKI